MTKPQDSKREEFRKYLERTGVMDAVAKILTALYEKDEKPTDALGFVFKSLAEDRSGLDNSNGESLEYSAKIKKLEAELAEAHAKILQLEESNAKKMDETVPPPSPAAEVAATVAEPVVSAPPPPIDEPMVEEAANVVPDVPAAVSEPLSA